MRTEPEAVPAVRAALESAGISVHIIDGGAHGRLAGLRPPMAAVEVHVPAAAAEDARRVLARSMARENERIRGHLGNLPVELLAFASWIGAIAGLLVALYDGIRDGWPWLVGALLCAALGWRLRRYLRPRDA